MINIGSRREVFFDDYLIDTENTTVETRLCKPAEKEVVLKLDKPWEIGCSYVHFFYDDGKYRMYYVAHNYQKMVKAKEGDEEKNYRVCYAESIDGINWVKPDLGICPWNDDTHTNIIFKAIWLDNFYVFKDTNPNCPADEKYKAIVKDNYFERHGLTSYFSADGVNFRPGRFITDQGAFDTMNVVFWDESINKYRGYIRSFHDIPVKRGTGDYLDYRSYFVNGENLEFAPGWDTDDIKKIGAGVLNLGKRDIRYIESEDFVNWTKPERINFGESEDIPLYTNCVSKYERAPHMYIGFPTRYMERKEWTKSFDVLSGREERIKRMKTLSKREGLAITDCAFMCSRDGFNFKRYDEAFLKSGIENDHNWFYGDCYIVKGFVQKDSVLWMYCPESTGEYSVIRRYELRTDGFVSLRAGGTEKVLKTKPFIFEGDTLLANISTSARGYAYFTIEDMDGNRIESCEMFGDSIEKPIGFEEDLSTFSGKEVTMTVRMYDADLYSVQFSKERG